MSHKLDEFTLPRHGFAPQESRIMSTAAVITPVLPPQSRGGHPLLGELPQFRQNPLERVQAWTRQYGPIARIRFGYTTRYVLTHPAYIEHVLQVNNRNYIRERHLVNIMRTALGEKREETRENLAACKGETWQPLRRAMQVVFHTEQVTQLGQTINDESQQMLAQWQQAARQDQPIEVESAMAHLTMAIISRTMFSTSRGPYDEQSRVARLTDAFHTTSNFVLSRTAVPFALPLAIPTPKHRRFKQAVRTIKRILSEIIQSRRQHGGDYHDLLNTLLMAHDEETGRSLTHAGIIAELSAIVFAGHKATSATLTWALYLLSQHPAIEERLHAEVDTALSGRTPTMDDLKHLPYTAQVLQETMRLYPAIWTTGREAVDEDQIDGYRIPAHAKLFLNIYGLHRHPDYWAKPAEFDPDRFTPHHKVGRSPYTYIPFGGGPHKCVGELYAMTEAQLILASIVQRYRLRVTPGHTVTPAPSFALNTREGLPMMLEPRVL